MSILNWKIQNGNIGQHHYLVQQLAVFLFFGIVISHIYIETQPIEWMITNFCGEALRTFIYFYIYSYTKISINLTY
ncbi:unnamed protein product [Paramecium sonneborni]|uniref:Uncharacterized protein n=1 Tax=Paramecium sonneborni TaxID=65129 RepID=A0A8S1NB43_9CILI|nr:unnamed protein product [Paramecium sonneborni]